MIRIAWPAFAFAALLASAALAQEAAITRRATEVREAPGDSSRSLAALPPQAGLTRTGERRGPWVQVRTADGVTGWVHLFDLGPATATTTGSDAANVVGGALRGITGLLGGSRPAHAGTTAGIRGLDAQDLARAQPNVYERAQMDKLRQGEAEARTFAEAAGLHPVAVADLPAPAAPAAAATPPAALGQPESP
jgi:hypothetical protein